jgi:hypothetical protein
MTRSSKTQQGKRSGRKPALSFAALREVVSQKLASGYEFTVSFTELKAADPEEAIQVFSNAANAQKEIARAFKSFTSSVTGERLKLDEVRLTFEGDQFAFRFRFSPEAPKPARSRASAGAVAVDLGGAFAELVQLLRGMQATQARIAELLSVIAEAGEAQRRYAKVLFSFLEQTGQLPPEQDEKA